MTSRARQLLGPEYAEDTEWVEQVKPTRKILNIHSSSHSIGAVLYSSVAYSRFLPY